MRSTRKLLSLFLCVALLAGLLSGCGGKKETPEPTPEATAVPEPTAAPEPDYAALYSQAAESAAKAENLVMTGSVKEERSIQGDTVREKNSFTATRRAFWRTWSRTYRWATHGQIIGRPGPTASRTFK